MALSRWGGATAPQASQQQQQPPPPQLQQRHAPPYVAQEHTYQVSEAVEAQWRHPDGFGWAKSNNWWPAVVQCVNDDGTYSIEFDNHYGRLTSVPANRMRPPRFSRVAPPPVSPLPHPPQTGPRGLHSFHGLVCSAHRAVNACPQTSSTYAEDQADLSAGRRLLAAVDEAELAPAVETHAGVAVEDFP